MKRIGAILSLVVLAAWSNIVRADKEATLVDDNFLIAEASSENAVIEISGLAKKHAGSPKVKEFAAELIKEHQQCYEKLAEVIKNRKVGVVAGLEKSNRAEVDRLSKLNGAEFDRAYLTWVIEAHKQDISRAENQVSQGKNAATIQFAKEVLPKLKEHLKRAEELSKSLGF